MAKRETVYLRPVTNINLARAPTGHVAMALEAMHDAERRPQRLECNMSPEQAIEIGLAIQEAGRAALRRGPNPQTPRRNDPSQH